MKMDGAKSITDTEGMYSKEYITVDRRAVRAEACSRGYVDRSAMKILVVVGA